MYGLIIDGLRYLIESHFNRDVWLECLKKAQVRNENFSSHERYSERMAPNILLAVCELSGKNAHDVGILAGRYFIKLMGVYDYDKLLRVLGRRFTDFVKGLDNLHEYFRLSYPKIRPPSFYCEREDSKGLVLHYRSRRTGYMSYVQGQLHEIADLFYNVEIKISVTKRDIKKGVLYSVLRIDFENSAYKEDRLNAEKSKNLNEYLRVDAVTFLNMFPFYIVFNKQMTIQLIGEGLGQLLPNLIGKKITEEFDLLRPVIKFTWEGVSMLSNNIFKLSSFQPVRRKTQQESVAFKVNDVLEDKIDVKGDQFDAAVVDDDPLGMIGIPVVLKGQMLKIKESEVFVYLASCEVENLDMMYNLGACVSDYSISDCNRDMIMTTVQQSDNLKALLKSEREKSQKLNRVLKMIELEKRQAKRLLAVKMPKTVAEYMSSISALEQSDFAGKHDNVSVLCIRMHQFEDTTYGWLPSEIVGMLNQVYSLLESVSEHHGCYLVETVMETGMLICGINPTTSHHAEYIVDAALELVEDIKRFNKDRQVPVELRMGIYSGTVQAGVVGIKSPRYTVFGDVVLCAGKLEALVEKPNQIIIGDTTYDALEADIPGVVATEDRGTIRLKGKGRINIYELLKKDVPPRTNTEPLIIEQTIDSDDDDLEDPYTPVEHSESSMSEATSRMSIGKSTYGGSSRGESAMSQAFTVGSPTGSRSGSQQSVRLDDDDENEVEEAVSTEHGPIIDDALRELEKQNI